MMPTLEPKKIASDFWLVTSERSAKLLTKRRYLLVLRQIIGEPRSISEISRAIEESLETTAYRVKQLHQAEIITQTIDSRRSKRYLAHPYWQIPNEFLAAASLEEFMLSFFQSSMNQVFMSIAGHLQISSQWVMQMDFTSAQFIDFLPASAHLEWLPILENLILPLKAEDALELQTELHSLSAKYRARCDTTLGKSHLLGLMFTRATQNRF